MFVSNLSNLLKILNLLDLFQVKLFTIFIITILTLIAGAYPFYLRKKSSYLNIPLATAFAQGIFLGAGLIHLLADSSDQFNHLGYSYPWAFLLAGMTFLLLKSFESFTLNLHPGKLCALLGTLMLSIHSLLEGAALGLSDNLLMLGIIFVAIMAHKWAAGFALSIQINQSTYGLKPRLFLFLIFALMTPLGIYLGAEISHYLKSNLLLEPIFNALAAGTFIYLGTSHGVHRIDGELENTRKISLAYLLFLILGFAFMGLIAIWV